MLFTVVAQDKKRNKIMVEEAIKKIRRTYRLPILEITFTCFISYMVLALVVWRCLKKHIASPIRNINDAI